MELSQKTVERLSLYRRHLMSDLEKKYIFSHELGQIANITASQVRRDLMNISLIGNPKKGYKTKKLLTEISKIISANREKSVVLFGVGRLGQAIFSYFQSPKSQINLTAAFDIDPKKIGNSYNGVKCFAFKDFQSVVKNKEIHIALIAVPAENAQKLVDQLVEFGIRSFVNFSDCPLKINKNVYVEEVNIAVILEKAAYFS